MTIRTKCIIPIACGCFYICLLLTSQTVSADNWADRTSVSGFMSAVYGRTNEATFFNGEAGEQGINNDGSFKGTRFGLNIRSKISEKVNFASQLFASMEGENYATGLDWAFVGIKLMDITTLRVGKIKYPVGLVNEYVDVGVAYPWVRPPEAIYSEGLPVTNEAYTGASLLGEISEGDWLYSADLFTGQVNKEGPIAAIKKLGGLTVKADWNEIFVIQLSSTSGNLFYNEEIDPGAPGSPLEAFDGEKIKTTLLGVRVDWQDYSVFYEKADVSIGINGANDMTVDSNYVTVGYHYKKYFPYITVQDWKSENNGEESGNKIKTLGINYELAASTQVKFEVSNVDTEGDESLFETDPGETIDDTVRMYGIAVDVVF